MSLVNPIAFEIFGLEVRWYGILIAMGMFIGSFIVLKTAKKKGYKEDDIIDLILVALPSGIVGARIYYVIFSWDYYAGDFMKMINLRGGGLAIHGGVIGGLIGGYIFCKRRQLNFLELADFVAPALVLAQSIGRWGNYANGEAHGGVTDLPWAILVDGKYVHPTFLYESIWNFLIFAFLMTIGNRLKKKHGDVFLMYMGLYSIGRFFIEGLRTDSLMLGPLRIAQVLSLVLISISAYFLFKRKNQNKV
jgi:prolipoprotein diacylglyceryl transferase